MRWDAVVVGAGPAGSATALRLARAGASVLLLDRARFPRHKPCSEYLSPETVRRLGALDAGALAAVLAHSPARLYGMRVVAPDGTSVVGRFASDHRWPAPLPYGLALPRADLDLILRDAAQRAGAVVREGAVVEDLLYEAGAVGGVVTRETGNPKGLPDGRGKREAVRGRVVIGADGLRSVVARRLGSRRTGWPRRVAFTAHVADVADVGELGEMHVGPRGYVGLGPVGGGITTIALVVPASRARLAPPGAGPSWRERFLPALEYFPRLAGRFVRAELVRDVLAVGPLAQWSRRTIADGACLVGDAADFFDPFTGQGIFAALRGAELLAEVLIAALAPERGGPVPREALAPYARARRRAFLGKWAIERLIGWGVGWPALTNRVVGRLARRPRLGDLVVGATGNFVPARALFAPHTLLRLLW